nr:Protein translocase subunit SecA like [Ipomoea batatas]
MLRPRICLLYSGYRECRHLAPPQQRWISSTPQLASWMEKVKSVFTGQKPSENFTLLSFANELSNARKLSNWKQYVVGRSSDATFADAFARQEAILRCLGGFDPTGENLQTSHKQEAAKLCKCTITDVENALAKYTWAKEAQKKLKRLKEEGKPMPKSMAEVQQLMGSSPLDLARSNLAKSGQISRNALCPCGSKKRYKRCCGKD